MGDRISDAPAPAELSGPEGGEQLAGGENGDRAFPFGDTSFIPPADPFLPTRQPTRRVLNILIGILGILLILGGGAIVASRWHTTARCGPLVAGCSPTVNNQGVLPRSAATTTHEPTVIAPRDLAAQQAGSVHICQFAHYDAVKVRCLTNDVHIGLTKQDDAQVVWPAQKGGTLAAALQVLELDRTRNWKVFATATPDGVVKRGTFSETLFRLFIDSGVDSHCGAVYLIRVVNADNHQFGQAPVEMSC